MRSEPGDFDPRKSMHPPGCALMFWSGIIVLIAIGAVMCWAVTAYAHVATPTAAQPNGWTYPSGCCSGIDCREVADQAIGEGPQGYTIKATGELIIYSDTRIRNSPDGRFHWCSAQGKPDTRTLCLFVPPKGF